MAYTLLDKLKEIMQGALPQPQNTGVGPTLANLNQPAQPSPIAQTQGQLPVLPDMGQPSGGGGLANTLAGMGKSFLGTAAETIPTAIFNAALFGNTPQSQAMTYASMVDKLAEKRKKAEERKTNKRAALGNFNYAIQEYGSKKYKVDPEVTMTAIYGDGTTGIPEFDAELKPHIDSIGTLIKQGDLDATDVDVSRIKSFEYRKAVLGDTMSLEKFEQQKELKLLGKEPKQETGQMRAYLSDVDNFGYDKSFADWKISQQKPDKPETPSLKRLYNIKTDEAKWFRPDIDPGADWTDVKPERAPKAPTPQQALKNIAQQKKIIYSLKNTGGIPAELLGNVSPETLKLLQGGDSSSAIQAAQDVIDYNKQFVSSTGTQSPAKGKSGNPLTGKKAGRYKVNGKAINWDGQKEIK